jgi:hypothetical protein
MDPISLILMTVQSLSVVLNNPALGGGSSLKFDQASALLGSLASLILAGKEGEKQLRELALMVAAMKEENRGPRPDEWAALVERRELAHEQLQALKPDLEVEVEQERAAKRAVHSKNRSR